MDLRSDIRSSFDGRVCYRFGISLAQVHSKNLQEMIVSSLLNQVACGGPAELVRTYNILLLVKGIFTSEPSHLGVYVTVSFNGLP